jgi:pentatricopeptide repeat protein
MDGSIKVSDKMIQKDCSPYVVNYNILIYVYCKDKRIDESMRLTRKMTNNGMIHTFVTYSTHIGGFFELKDLRLH